jgi:AcrR family transcriptional regulator
VAESATDRDQATGQLTAWQQRTLDRSLDDAKRRALTKSRRFVNSAIQLLRVTGGLEFTVQDVVDRAKLSIRSFYQSFASKDDLLLALFEESVAAGAVELRAAMAEHRDPIEQIHVYLTTLWAATDNAGVSRALALYHLTLASTRPRELAHALEPQLAVLREAVERGVASGQIRSDVTPRRLSEILLHTSVAAVHTAILHTSTDGRDASPDDLWAFCLGGLARPE